jgi:hypothetical protein
LLFVPFGFGLTDKLREKGKSRAAAFLTVWAAGALFSYTVEVLQIYIPTRDSGWGDVITNSSGSVVGYVAFEIYGKWVLGAVRATENVLSSFLRPRTAALLLLTYFGIWFVASYRLQTTTRLEGWDPNPILVLGNDTWTRPWQAWAGQVLSLDLWDRALPDSAGLALTAGAKADAGFPDPIAAYNLSSGSAPQDAMKFLPALVWRPAVATPDQGEHLALGGQAWLVSEDPVPQFVARLEKSDQFSIRIICQPAESSGADGRILFIGGPAAPPDLTIRQQNTSLIFWFHTPLSTRHAQLTWTVPNVFAAGQSRNILYTYDGSNLSLFIDGKKVEHPYSLGPGPALARYIRRIKPAELEGYADIYYALIFFPAGVLLGLASRKAESHGIGDWLLFGVLLVAPPWLLEVLLTRTSGRAFHAGNAVLSLALSIAGALWINIGRGPAVPPDATAGRSAPERA